jgi:hypothetical protein
MITIESSISPQYSVSCYPEEKYKGGAGYFMHMTDDVERTRTPGEIKEEAGKATVRELRDIASFVTWKK